MRHLSPRLLPLGLACLVAAACGKDATGPVASQVTKVAGDNQAGFPGDTLAAPLRIRVTSSSGEPVPGVPVTWSSSNASLSATHGLTGADGTASITAVLSLQPAHGAVLAVAGPSNALVGMADFSIEIKDPCAYPVPLTIGATVGGTITIRDCILGDSSHLDTYGFSVPATTRVRFTMTSADVDPYLLVMRADGVFLGWNDNADTTSNAASIDFLLPAGTDYRVWTNTAHGNDFGTYQMTSAALPVDISDCVTTWLVSTNTSQTLPATGCRAPDLGSPIADHFALIVFGGNHLAVSMTAAGFASQVRIFSAFSVVASATAAGPGQTATAAYDVPWTFSGMLVVQCSDSAGASPRGAYTLGVVEPRAPAGQGVVPRTKPLFLSRQ